MNAPENPLFREEALQARRQRVHGEIVLTQPVRTQMLVLLLFVVVAAMAAWVVFGTYTRTEAARGILVTDIPSAKIIAIRPGRITELLVHDGDFVRPGQRLASIRIEQNNEAGRSSIAESLGAIEAQRGLAERQAHLAVERGASERAHLAAALAGLEQQRSDLSAQIALQDQVVTSTRETFQRLKTIIDKGFVSRVEYEARRQAWLSARQQLGQLKQQLNSVDAQEEQTRADLTKIAADTKTEIANARSSAQALAEQHAQLLAERAYVLTTPIAGRVTALQTAPGRTVDPSIPLMVIVPQGSKLHANIYAPTSAIGFVKPGEEVRLLYDAFPYQRFGSFTGRITEVSRTVLDPRELSAPLKIEEPVYRIEVTPARQAIDAFGQKLPLQPGMTLTANIILDRRSFGDWLLKPLNAVLRRDR